MAETVPSRVRGRSPPPLGLGLGLGLARGLHRLHRRRCLRLRLSLGLCLRLRRRSFGDFLLHAASWLLRHCLRRLFFLIVLLVFIFLLFFLVLVFVLLLLLLALVLTALFLLLVLSRRLVLHVHVLGRRRRRRGLLLRSGLGLGLAERCALRWRRVHHALPHLIGREVLEVPVLVLDPVQPLPRHLAHLDVFDPAHEVLAVERPPDLCVAQRVLRLINLGQILDLLLLLLEPGVRSDGGQHAHLGGSSAGLGAGA